MCENSIETIYFNLCNAEVKLENDSYLKAVLNQKSKSIFVELIDANINNKTLDIITVKADQIRVYTRATVEESKFKIDLGKDVFDKTGIVYCQLVLKDVENARLSSDVFRMFVNKF